MRESRSSLRTWSRSLFRSHTLKVTILAALPLSVLVWSEVVSVDAQSKETTTLSLFKGRAVVKVPKTTKKPTKLYSNLLLARPTDATKKFALYISRDRLGTDELKMTNKQLGESIKTRLQGEGYTIVSFKNQGLTFTANIEGFTTVPWQSVGTAPIRGVARFSRTADKLLIGSVLLCDPPAWSGADVQPYKTAVMKLKVSKK